MPPATPESMPLADPMLTFNVNVPENTPASSSIYLEMLGDNGGSFKMEKTGRNVWSLKENLDKYKNKEITYRYNRGNWGFVGAEEFSPDSKTANRKISVDEKTREINDTIEKWRWMPKEESQLPVIQTNAGKAEFLPRAGSEKFQKGAMFVDFWWGNFKDLLDSTHARLKEKGFQWIEIAPPWDYKQVNPLPIITYEGFGHTYPDDTLDFHLSKMKEDGFKVYMMPQICCADTSKASFSKEWWDAWFNEYEKYTMYFADKASKHNVDYLVISGDWVAVAASPDKSTG